MLLSAELPTEEFTPEIPLEQQLWPEAIESPKIKLDIPENTATDFAPPQVSVISDEHISNELNIDLNIDRESFSQANHAFQRLSATYPSGIKVGFSNDLDIEDIPKRDIRDLGVILDTWNNANETYFYLDSRPHQYFYSPIKEQWDDLAVEQKAHLRTVLGVNFDTLAQDFFSGSGDVPDGIRTLQELIKNPDFQEKENLTNYLMQEGWLAKRNFFRSNPNEDENTYSRSRYSYEYTKFEINQLLCSAAVDLAEQGNSAQLGTILEHFAFSRVPSDSRFNLGDFPSPYEDATSVLLDENLSSDGRRVVLKEFVKVFGPISTVDTLSNKIHALSRTGNNKEESYIKDLINLYSLIEGENVLAPMEKLTNVYDVVDYAALDRPELTAKEATRLEAVARLFAEGAEYSTVDGHVVKFASTAPAKEQTEVVILDTGAGNARVSRELFIRGYKNCSALEYDPKNIRYALEKRPSEDFGILRGSWHNIPLATADYTNMNKAIDVCFTTERSFLHDRTAAEWFGLFDEFRRVSHYIPLFRLEQTQAELHRRHWNKAECQLKLRVEPHTIYQRPHTALKIQLE